MKTINLITGAHPNFMKVTPMFEFLRPLAAQAEPLERMLALEQRFFLADHNLIYTDKMSMTVGVQLRAACSVRCVYGVYCVGCVRCVRRSLRAACSVDASYTLLSLLCIEIWCRTFIDKIPRKSPQPPFYQRGETEGS